MGYTTEFKGTFSLNKPLSEEHAAYLRAFSTTRRMRRDASKCEKMADPARVAVGLPVGHEGLYFVGGTGFYGQDHDPSILDYNESGAAPGLWCQWTPTEDNAGIKWNGAEKFYDYTEWLQFIVEHFLKPWGYVLNGTVRWKGEDRRDVGRLVAQENVISAVKGAK